MSLPNAASGIALSEADMDAREMILGSTNPISPTIFTSTVTRPFDREMQMKQSHWIIGVI